MKVKLTVVIPIYGPTYAAREMNLKSIVNSSEQVIMIIVADSFEASTRESLINLIKNKPLGSVQVIEGNFGNPGSARNAGLEIANTEWISFWDSDDQPDATKFLKMIAAAETEGYDIAKGEYQISNPLTNYQFNVKNSEIAKGDMARHITDPGIWRYAFSKEVYKGLRFPPFRMGEDQDFLVQVLLQEKTILSFNENVYVYKVGDETQLTVNPHAFKDVAASLDFLRFLLRANKNSRSASLIIMTSYVKQTISALRRFNAFHPNLYSTQNLRFLTYSFFAGKLFKPILILVSERLGNR